MCYDSLYDLANLEAAYAHLRRSFSTNEIIRSAFQPMRSEEAEKLLRHVSKNLQSGAYRPDPDLRASDLVVQATISLVLAPASEQSSVSFAEQENCIKWVANAVRRGLTREYSEEVVVHLDSVQDALLLERLRRRVGDDQIVQLLRKILATYAGIAKRALLIPLLTKLAFDGIDRIFAEAKKVAWQGSIHPIECARFENHLIALSDPDPQCDWLLPAINKRLRDELTVLKWEVDPERTQVVNLLTGGTMTFMGFELSCAARKDGALHVQYKREAVPSHATFRAVIPSVHIRLPSFPIRVRLGGLLRKLGLGWCLEPLGPMATRFARLATAAVGSGSASLFADAHAYVAVACGAMLGLAAFVQAKNITDDKLAGAGFLDLLFIQAEILLGIWLLSGQWPSPCRRAAIASFAAFTAYSAYRGLMGSCDCGCFGGYVVNPWLILLLDLLAVAALLKWPPVPRRDLLRTHPIQFVSMVTVFVATGFLLPNPVARKVKVDGVVTLDGAPLTRANMILVNLDNGFATAARTNIRGEFRNASLAPGRYGVGLSKLSDPNRSGGAKKVEGQPAASRTKIETVPSVYVSPQASPLRIDISKCGANGVRLELVSDR